MRICFACVALFIAQIALAGELWVPSLFSSHMVVQRGKPLAVWGKDKAGTAVTVELADHKATAQADEQGDWHLTLDHGDFKGSQPLTILGTEKLTFEDVVCGEVWLASGQSNMAWRLENTVNGEAAIAGTNAFDIRFLKVQMTASPDPLDDPKNTWTQLTPENAKGVSAVAFYFARRLHQQLQVPVGVIQAAWGGTRIEAWMPLPVLDEIPEAKQLVASWRHQASMTDSQKRRAQEFAKQWSTAKYYTDPGNRAYFRGWADSDFDDASWKTMALPNHWESQGEHIDGSIWFRRWIELPEKWQGKELALSLGPIDDFDHTYINGELVGHIGFETPEFWTTPRKYTIPGRLTKERRLLLAVRVFDHYGSGGIYGNPDSLVVSLPGSHEVLSLAGDWKYEIEYSFPEDDDLSQQLLTQQNQQTANLPAHLYNGMIHPVQTYPIKGAIWYQGESNAGNPYAYAIYIKELIKAWRNVWQDDSIGFFSVQLANWKAPQTRPSEGSWAWIREAQATSLDLPLTGMATAIDVGEEGDVHPRLKTPVGERLADSALHKMYGREDLPVAGPTFSKFEIDGSKVIVHFKTTGGGLSTNDGATPTGFALRNRLSDWHWADAVIDGNRVILTSKKVPEPTDIRYAWAMNPRINTYGKNGLPVLPFRTDDEAAPGSH